ncbi:MAG: tetratricopeptide repeat protein [Elusimicrobiota bacterium]
MKKYYSNRWIDGKMARWLGNRFSFLSFHLSIFPSLYLSIFLSFYLSIFLYAESKKEKIRFYISKGDEYLMRGEYSYAITFYTDAKKIKKKNPVVLLKLGEAYRGADMHNEAIFEYNKALKYGSKDIRIYLGLGAVYYKKLLYEKAEEYYKKVLQLDNSSIEALNGLAVIYKNTGRDNEAIDLYKRALALCPTDSIKNSILQLNVLTGKYAESEPFFTTSFDSRILEGYINMKKNPDIAISNFTAVNAHFLVALTYLKKNNIAEAKKNLAVLLNTEENTLSKKLAIALQKYIE